MALIALPSTVQAFFFLRLLVRLITVRNEAGYPEGVSVYGFLTAYQTHRLYLPPLNFPWNAQPYGPLFILVGAFFAKIFHGEPTPLTVLMRSLSFAAFLGSIAIIGCLCWKLERRKIWTAMTVMLGLGCFWYYSICAQVRPDLISIFLILAALALYDVSENRLWLYYLAGILGTASFLTKQSTAPILLALFIDCLLARRFKAAAIFVAGGGTLSIPLLGYLWIRHEPFLANFTVIGHTVRDWHSIPFVVSAALRVNQLSVIALTIALLGAVLSWKEKRYRSILLVTAFAWASNIAALANEGGNVNYYVLPWLLSMLFVPAGLNQLERWSERSLLIPAAVFCVASIIVIHQKSLLGIKAPGALDASIVANVKMLSDIPYLNLRSRQPQLIDPLMYNHLSKTNVWSDDPILKNIDTGDYDLLLLGGADTNAGSGFVVAAFRGTSFWGADVLREIALHYRDLCETSDHLALVPLDRASSVTSGDISRIFNQPCRATSVQPQVAAGAS